MTGRTKVTDEIADRFVDLHCEFYEGAKVPFPLSRSVVALLLDGAINPPAEDIPVTEEQLDAGNRAWNAMTTEGIEERTEASDKWCAGLYRAMRKLEKSTECSPPTGLRELHVHRRAGDFPATLQGRRVHRRKDDPA